VNAPWNSNAGLPTAASTPITAKLKDSSLPNGLANGKESVVRALPDARLHATWDYEAKRYNDVLPIGRRGRMNSMSGLTLSISGRAQGESKI
jgi:Wiskott-Aldrich syndrome protein